MASDGVQQQDNTTIPTPPPDTSRWTSCGWTDGGEEGRAGGRDPFVPPTLGRTHRRPGRSRSDSAHILLRPLRVDERRGIITHSRQLCATRPVSLCGQDHGFATLSTRRPLPIAHSPSRLKIALPVRLPACYLLVCLPLLCRRRRRRRLCTSLRCAGSCRSAEGPRVVAAELGGRLRGY